MVLMALVPLMVVRPRLLGGGPLPTLGSRCDGEVTSMLHVHVRWSTGIWPVTGGVSEVGDAAVEVDALPRRGAAPDVVAAQLARPLLLEVDRPAGGQRGREDVESAGGERVPAPAGERAAAAEPGGELLGDGQRDQQQHESG